MPVFKTYFKIINRNKKPILLYFCIFIVLILLFTVNGMKQETSYSNVSTRFTLIDRDGGGLGDYLKKELSRNNTYTEAEDDMEKLQNRLFYRQVSMIVIIPEGFTEDFLAGKEVTADTMQVEGSMASVSLEQELNSYLNGLKVYLEEGYSLSEAEQLTSENQQLAVDTKKVDVGKRESTPVDFYFRYIPYIIISVILCGMAPVMATFQKKELRRRDACSAYGLRRQNTQLILGSLAFGVLAIVILDVIGFFFVGRTTDFNVIKYAFINTLLQMIITMAASFAISFFVSGGNAVNAIANVFSLGSCFLGGIYVPLEFLNKGLLKISKFIPAYWYIQANTVIMENETLTAAMKHKIYQSYGIQLMFAIFIFAIALAISKRRYVVQ